VLAVAVSMAQGFREQRQVVETESAARGALDYIADALRMSSPAISNGKVTTSDSSPASGDPHLIIGGDDGSTTNHLEDTTSTATTCARGSINVYNNAGLNASDILEIVFASGGTVTSLGVAATWTTALPATITLNEVTNLAVGDRLLITDGARGHVVKVTSINTGTGVVGIETASCTISSASYPLGSLVIRVMRARFYLDAFDGVATVLMMDPDADGAMTPEPLADWVEDFQIAAGIDEDGSDAVDLDEWGFSGAAGTPATFTTSPAVTLRAIRISLVTRAANSLVATTAAYRRPGLEDHVQATTLDTLRRRVLSSTIDIRNLGDSP
jgi:Type IV Pilus-assembly protein W